MSDKENKSSKNNVKTQNQNLKSDGLFKSVFGTKIAAQEFLEEYLPPAFKQLVDLKQIEIDKESFVEEDLQRRLSDVVYKVKLRDDKNLPQTNDKTKSGNRVAFIYCLIEHTSSNDHLMAYRVWKYVLLLLERYIEENKIDGKSKVKLPLVFPLVVYGGNEKYKAAKNFWQLFNKAEMAKAALGGDYALIDLQSIDDNDIRKDQHIAIVKYMLKHIKDRDLVKVWDNMLKSFPDAVLLDKKRGYIYIKKLLWYSDARLEDKDEDGLKRVLETNLDKNEGNKIMRTIADKYREEAIHQRDIAIAMKMISKNKSEEEVAEFTDLSIKQINKLKTQS